MDNILENKYFLRYNCDLLRNMLSFFDKEMLPPDIYSSLFDLVSACDDFISDGYSYCIFEVSKGNFDIDFSSPTRPAEL